MSGICSKCGNNHFGICATEETYFVWEANANEMPNQVLIAGSWKKWQTFDKLSREISENGEAFFRISLTLHPGTYQYKYVVDGEWKLDPNSPTIQDEHDEGIEKWIKVYPKKMLLPINKEGEIKITSNLLIDGLKLLGSWDGWTKEISMTKIVNHLVNREEFFAYVSVEPNKEYEFKFKLKKQFLIDQKYPTTRNEFNTQNNIIITTAIYNEDCTNEDSAKKEKTATPNKNLSARPKNIKKDFSCKSFEWVTVSRSFDLPYKRVEGHSMCAIGDYIYIFGGFCRNEYYNSLTKLSVQLTSAKTQEALPEGRAYSNMVTYGNKIIIYGGHSNAILQNYYSFNVSQEKWVAVPKISGKYPEKVEKQSCVLYEQLMVFFGGYYCSHDCEYQAYYNSISVLDIEYMKWIDQIEVSGQEPRGRFAHTATLIESDMYIFGGIYNAAENLCLNDIWKINLSKVNELSWKQLEPKGKKPCPRHGHTMNALHNYIVVFGGHSSAGEFLNDVFIFNTTQQVWFEPMIRGEVPRPRYYHSAATVLQHDEIIVFGGRTNNHIIQNLYILRPNQKISALNINEEDNDE